MNINTSGALALLLIATCSFAPAALADHDNNGHGNNYNNGHGNYNNGHGNNYNNGHGNNNGNGHGNNYNNYRNHYQSQKKAIKEARRQYSWNEERGMYRNNWDGVSVSQRQQYDAQLAAQWRAYHHNNWKGQSNWSNYNDPAFLDYVHTSNPGLLTNLRSILNF